MSALPGNRGQTTYGRTLRGSQRYKCRAGARLYTPDRLPLDYPDETRREAVRLYLEGVNFRRIARVLGVNHQSVINWSNAYHTALPVPEQSVVAPEVVELDELFTFVGSNKRKPTSSRPEIAPRAALSPTTWCGSARPELKEVQDELRLTLCITA